MPYPKSLRSPNWAAAVQARAARLEQVLCGYMQLPDSMEKPVNIEINPSGDEARAKLQVSTVQVQGRRCAATHPAWFA